jgi:hypothetical protein
MSLSSMVPVLCSLEHELIQTRDIGIFVIPGKRGGIGSVIDSFMS